jgi:hypothetical protein
MGLIALIITAAAALGGFVIARNFVRRRLRFVDGVYSPTAPFIAGLVAAALAAPVAWLLPLVTGVTAALFGIGAGVGTASGVKALRRGNG